MFTFNVYLSLYMDGILNKAYLEQGSELMFEPPANISFWKVKELS